MTAAYRLAFEEMAWEPAAPLVRQKRVELGTQVLRLLEFQRGFVDDEWCTREHTGYVLRGRLTVTFSDRTIDFKEGDGIHIPPGDASRHRASAVEEGALLLLVEPV